MTDKDPKRTEYKSPIRRLMELTEPELLHRLLEEYGGTAMDSDDDGSGLPPHHRG